MASLENEIGDKLKGDALSLSGSFDFGRWSQHSQAATSEESPSVSVPTSSELEHMNSVPRVLIHSISLGARIAESDDLQFGPQLGQGSSMAVHQGFLDGEAVAIKKCRPWGPSPASKQTSLMSLQLELKVLLSDFIKPHPNIVDLLAVSWVEETQPNGQTELVPLLVMELAVPEARTLHDLIPTIDPLNFQLKGQLISDILGGLDAIHSDRFIHGDLKPENVLIFRHGSENRYTAKLADFGFSDDVEQLPFGVDGNPAGGTDYWNAPECLDSRVDLKTCRRPSRDLYSFGLVAWYIVASELPFGADRGLEWAAAYDSVTALKLRDGVAVEASKFFDGRSGRLGLDLGGGWREALRSYLGSAEDEGSNGLDDVGLSVGLLDELLWRGNASWSLGRKPANGYLPYAVTLLPRLLAKDPAKRGRVRDWLRLLWVNPSRQKATRKDWRVIIPPSSRRDGWMGMNKRRAEPGYTMMRRFGELSPTMVATLRRAIDSEMANSQDRVDPILRSVLQFLDLYAAGYPSAQAPSMASTLLDEMKTWAARPTDDPDTIGIRSGLLAGVHHSQGRNPPSVLRPEHECEVMLSGLCLDLYGFEKRAGTHRLKDSFRQLLDELLRVFSEDEKLEILRLWHSAYRLAVVSHRVQWSRETLRPRRRTDPEYNSQWNRMAQAIRRDDVRVFKQAFEEKALPGEINLATAEGRRNMTLLAVEQHLPNILAYLVDTKAIDLDEPLKIRDNLMVPVQLSVYQGKPDATTTLLGLGADPRPLFEFGFVRDCIDSGMMESVGLLLTVKAQYAGPGVKPSRQYRSIQNFDFNKKEYDTQLGPRTASPMMIAIAHNSWQTFAELVSIGVDIQLPCLGHYNPLQVAVQFRRPLFVAALLDAGADPNVRTLGKPLLHDFLQEFSATGKKTGWSYGDATWMSSREQMALDAARHDRIILDMLLSHPKTNLDARDLLGRTPFLAAVEAKKMDWAEELVHAGANPLATMYDGASPLHVVSQRGMGEVAKWLLERWPEMLHGQDYAKRAPIHSAMEAGQDGMVELLLNAGHDVSSQDSFGYTILHHTLVTGQIDTFHNIWLNLQQSQPLTLPSLLTIRDMFGRTPIHLLAELSIMRPSDFAPYIPFLTTSILPLITNPSLHTDNLGLTPLHFLAAGTPQLCSLFLSANFPPTATDHHWHHSLHPLDLAHLASNASTIPLLQPTPSSLLPTTIKGPEEEEDDDDDDGKNAWRIATILNDHINRATLAHARRAEAAIARHRRAEHGVLGLAVGLRMRVQRMGVLTHEGLFLDRCVFCDAEAAEVEVEGGVGGKMLGCVVAGAAGLVDGEDGLVDGMGRLYVGGGEETVNTRSEGQLHMGKEGDWGREGGVNPRVGMVGAIGELLSGVEGWLEAIVMSKGVARDGDMETEVKGREGRIRALLADPDGVKRRAVIMSGVWESDLRPKEVEYLMGVPGRVMGFTAGGSTCSS